MSGDFSLIRVICTKVCRFLKIIFAFGVRPYLCQAAWCQGFFFLIFIDFVLRILTKLCRTILRPPCSLEVQKASNPSPLCLVLEQCILTLPLFFLPMQAFPVIGSFIFNYILAFASWGTQTNRLNALVIGMMVTG